MADSTDVYAFVSPDQPGTVTLIANYIPLQAPDGGPNFYEFADDVLYEIHVDNTGDGPSSNLGGGIIFTGNGPKSLTLRNSIIAGNFLDTPPTSHTDLHVQDNFDSGGTKTITNCVIGDPNSAAGAVNGVNGNIVGFDPKLGPLQNNSGPTLTHLPLADSPALGAGDRKRVV